MIPTKARENRRMKVLKLSKNLERKYKEVKCRECKVVVTPMDFAKILGRFTKVKIQYESSTKSKPKQTNVVSPSSRLKAKENGMVQIHRHAYNAHPGQKLLGLKKSKTNALPTPTTNVLKENNRLKKPDKVAYTDYNDKLLTKSKVKYYGIIFDKPSAERKRDIRSKISLQDLVSDINKSILPNEDWCIDYFPKNGEPKDDKIYDRIAAELEDLMYNEKTKISSNVKDSKNDEFPSILDILNENTKDGSTKTNDPAGSLNLESSDVEAMLLGNTSPSNEPAPMEVDGSVNSLINKSVQPSIKCDENKNEEANIIDDNPESPSILDEQVQKDASTEKIKTSTEDEKVQLTNSQASQIGDNDNTNNKKHQNSTTKMGVTQIIFKKSVNGTCYKSVTCPKNLKYSISMLGKSVELLGAPKHVSSLEDLQVLLQIVEESELDNLYVLH